MQSWTPTTERSGWEVRTHLFKESGQERLNKKVFKLRQIKRSQPRVEGGGVISGKRKKSIQKQGTKWKRRPSEGPEVYMGRGGQSLSHQESGKDEVTEVVFAMPSRGSCKELKQYSLGTLPCTCSRRIMWSTPFTNGSGAAVWGRNAICTWVIQRLGWNDQEM